MVEEIEDFQLPPNDDDVAARTLDSETLDPPETRLGDSWAIRSRIAEMLYNDETRARKRAKMQNWNDGARPFSEKKLQRLGQGDRTNFNPREAERMADTAKTPYYGLVFRNPQFAVIENNYGNNPQLRSLWSSSISRSGHRALEEWSAFDFHMQLKQWQMVFYGVGLALFPDAEDWQFRSCKIGNFLVPDRALALIEELPEASYFREINPVDLFKLIDQPGAEKNGWFVDRVKAEIIKKAPERLKVMPSFGEQQWNEEWVRSLRCGDVMWNADSSMIRLAGYLIKEFNGKISHALLVDDGQPPNPSAVDDDDALLLFKKVNCFDSFEQVVQPFFFDIGTGEWHSIKGLGPKIVDNTQASARLICAIIDGGRRGAAAMLQAQDAASEQISQLIEIGGATIIPSGLAMQQNRIAENLNGPMGARKMLADINQDNIGQFSPQTPQENTKPTLGQEQLSVRQGLQLSEAAADRYCKSGDRLYTEIFRRMALMGVKIYKKLHPDETTPPDDYELKTEKMTPSEKGAYYFVRRCVEEGVPIDAMDPKWFCSVKMMRGVGSGSPAAMDVATSQGLQLMPAVPEAGRNVLLRLRLAFLFGQQMVDSIVPPLDQVSRPDDQASLAVLENNALRLADGEVLINSTQNHPIHFQYHFNDLAKHFQLLDQKQADPMAVLAHAHKAGPHLMDHLKEMEGDPTRKAQVEQMHQNLVMISKLTDQLQQHIEQAMKAKRKNPPAPQLDPALIQGLAKVKGELQIKQTKMQGDMALKAAKQQQSMHLKDAAQGQSMQLKTLQALHDIQMDRAQAAA